MFVVSNETPMFTRWHYLNAHGHRAVRSRVHHGMLDVYDPLFHKSPQAFVKRMRFAVESLGCCPTTSMKVIHGFVPNVPDVMNPHVEYEDLKQMVMVIDDEPVPLGGRIILGMGGTRRLVDVLKRIPAGANVLVGRYGLAPCLQSLTTRLPGEALEEEYFQELARIGCEHFTLSSRYFSPNSSHSVCRLSHVRGNILAYDTSEYEPLEDMKVDTDDFVRPLLKFGTFMESLKLAWVACNWEKRLPSGANRVRVSDLFEKRAYNVKNTSYGARMVHGYRDDGTNVEERMIVHKGSARRMDRAFRSDLRKGMRLHYDIAVVNPGHVHSGIFETVSHRLAIRARTHVVKIYQVVE